MVTEESTVDKAAAINHQPANLAATGSSASCALTRPDLHARPLSTRPVPCEGNPTHPIDGGMKDLRKTTRKRLGSRLAKEGTVSKHASKKRSYGSDVPRILSAKKPKAGHSATASQLRGTDTNRDDPPTLKPAHEWSKSQPSGKTPSPLDASPRLRPIRSNRYSYSIEECEPLGHPVYGLSPRQVQPKPRRGSSEKWDGFVTLTE
ncbi:hypothetical protein EKO04_011596 [Ascochyta lentis]|uniref:Uncharacterized protein n=1 Tax=Ascochyta lentis TaxID=205686 RepID=A0A8H7ISG1_9PLEO|nr:hypothetical protein EKO04_011596 [Ascochyta lentis]